MIKSSLIRRGRDKSRNFKGKGNGKNVESVREKEGERENIREREGEKIWDDNRCSA